MAIIQVTNTYSGNVLSLLRSCSPYGFEVRTLRENSASAFLSAVQDADYILASGRLKITSEILASAKKLKMIQRTGVGLDSLDLDAIKARNIPLYVNQGVNAQSVAEHTVLLILACLRRLCEINRNTKNGIWRKQAQGITTYELHEKTVGLIGMGHIGRKTAAILKSFGAEILYYDAFRRSEDEERVLGIRYVSLEELFRQSQVVSLHCPLNEATRHLISSNTISMMRENVIIVNTARGTLIDEQALYEALLSGKVGYAALDVHSHEPVTDTSGLLSLDNVIATPHIGGVTYDSFYGMMSGAMRNIALFEQGRTGEIEQYRFRNGDD